MPIDTVPAGRFAPSAWVLVSGSDEYVDLGWSEDGTGGDYLAVGRFVTRAAAEGAMRAAEAEVLPEARESLAASGFVKEEPTLGFSTRTTTHRLGGGNGIRSVAWIKDQMLVTHVMVPGKDGPYASDPYATVSLPEDSEDRPCAFVGVRTHGALVIAMLMGAWESRPKAA